MYLHMFMAEVYIGVVRQLPSVVGYLRQCSVAGTYQRQKEQLIEYAEELLAKAVSLLEED
jgi:hypothetical protein